MKFFAALCFLAVVASGLARPQRPGPPMDHAHDEHMMPYYEMSEELVEFVGHIKDFVELYPKREIRQIVREFMRDPELRATIKFVRSPRFMDTLHTIAETPEVQAIGKYFAEANWPWIQSVVDEAVEELETTGMMAFGRRSTGGLNGMLDAIIAVLPKEQLRALFDEKVESSAVFRSVIEIFSSEELKALMETAHQSPLLQEQFGILLENGIDMEKIVKVQFALVGY